MSLLETPASSDVLCTHQNLCTTDLLSSALYLALSANLASLALADIYACMLSSASDKFGSQALGGTPHTWRPLPFRQRLAPRMRH